jgi:hypothetical protein
MRIAPHLLVQPLGGESVDRSQVGVEKHPLPTHDANRRSKIVGYLRGNDVPAGNIRPAGRPSSRLHCHYEDSTDGDHHESQVESHSVH